MPGFLRCGAWLVAAFGFGPMAAAQTPAVFPSGPIRIITQYSPGGGVDFLARVIAEGLHQRWGQPAVVESRTGGGGIIATDAVAKAAPDGHTLLLSDNVLTVMPAMRRALPFDVKKDLVPISLVATSPLVLLVHPSVPVSSVRELVSYVNQNPGKLSYASSGLGSVQHIAMEVFKSKTGIAMVHVPYRGSAGALVDLTAGRVQTGFQVIGSALPHLEAGTVRPIAVSETTRTAKLPDVPTIQESGIPGYDTTTWYGVLGPAGMSPDILEKLNDAITQVLDAPKTRDILAVRGILVHPRTTPQMFSSAFFAARIDTEVAEQLDLSQRGILNFE